MNTDLMKEKTLTVLRNCIQADSLRKIKQELNVSDSTYINAYQNHIKDCVVVTAIDMDVKTTRMVPITDFMDVPHAIMPVMIHNIEVVLDMVQTQIGSHFTLDWNLDQFYENFNFKEI